MPLSSAGRKRRAGIASALLAAGLALGCSREPSETPEPPVPALSRAGSRWTVSRGNRVVFRMENTPGAVGWKRERPEPSFIRGEVLDAREEARLHPLVARAKNLRDLVRRLERAGYGVGADAETPAGG